ncbi:MAG TPA: aspartate aminotransferase family protein [Candidatus Dormibacteraeota bacterium]|nr:aspartate aminotransferase family protein [Candidatus Dormibacteraeota bacterium]
MDTLSTAAQGSMAPLTTEKIVELDSRYVVPTYRRLPVLFVRGEGCELVDAEGRRYLDFVAGIAVCALGHAHPAVTAAIAAQAATLVHASNLYYTAPQAQLAAELVRRSGLARAFFCNSGTEANEAAIKLARKHAYRRGQPERTTIVTMEGAFHGRTFGSLAATPNPKYQEGFAPLPGGFKAIPFGDVAAARAAIDERTAAVLVEPVQGESGIHPADPAYLGALREICTQRGALLIFDEVQCGLGRIGTPFAFQHYGVVPDAVTLAKGLANGLPIGALVVGEAASESLQPGDHGTTFGGNPVACAAALAHLAVSERDDVPGNARKVGAVLRAELERLAAAHPTVLGDVRGLGLMLGVQVKEPVTARAIVEAGLEERVVVNDSGGNTLRFVPPLILTAEQAREGVRRLERAIARI